MRGLWATWLRCVAVISAAVLFLPATAGGPSDLEVLTSGNTGFALDLYARLRSQKGNLVFSPYSMSSALAMTYAGARGTTEAEMAKALRFGMGQTRTHAAFAQVSRSLDEAGRSAGVELAVANSLWPDVRTRLLPAYTALMRQRYGVTITPLDYAHRTEKARQTINGWVEGKTRRKIKDLLNRGAVNALTTLVLVNAMYFKGNWAVAFRPEYTLPQDFAVPGAGKVRVPMMNQKGMFPYARVAGAHLLEMPYKGGRLAMVFVLPERSGGLTAMERSLKPAILAAWQKALRPQEVRVAVPRFRALWGTFEMKPILKALGMRKAFTSDADFSGMTGGRCTGIDHVLHKALVEVNETGTVAAAATAVVMTKGAPRPSAVFRADRPFLFYIRDRRTGTILFMGRILDPRKQ